jgi:two-component system sensor kinase FixL
MALAHLSLLFLILFVADAIRDLWRRGERRRAITIGGSIVVFVTAGTMTAVLSFWGIAPIPFVAMLLFTPIVMAMSFELSRDLIRSARLATAPDAKTVELRESEQKLALAADAANAGLWSIDGLTGRLWATPRALDMYALEHDREHGTVDVLRSIHPDDRDRVRAFAEGARREDHALATIEYRVVDAGGAVRWYASHGRAQDSGLPARKGLMGVTIDITDRKRAEDENASQRAELEHLGRVATVSELSGALAHELNQPLAIIMSNAEAAQQLLERSSPESSRRRCGPG